MGHQFEGFLSDIDRYGDRLRFQRQFDEYKRRQAEKYRSLEESLCRVYAHREALMLQLEKFDPSNPLLHDQDLRNRLGAAAVNAFFNNPDPDGVLSYNRARDVGRTFKIPGR